MSGTSTRFLEAIALKEVGATLLDIAYEAVPQYVPWPKAYGGDMVAQSVAAAARTVEPPRALHSMHSYFMRPVEIGTPVRYEVEVLRDGRGYSTRHVRAIQSDKLAFIGMLSYHTGAESPEFQVERPLVPGPEELPSSADSLDGGDSDAECYWALGRSFDMRHVPSPLYISIEGAPVPHQGVWVKAFDMLPDDPVTQQVALAYVCDYTILEPALRALGVHWSTPGLVTASLDHAMWFHRPARVDDWLLYAQEAVSVGNGRGLCSGRFFDRQGRLIATVAQEGLISLPQAPSL